MELIVKTFDELDTRQLLDLLTARARVFVVEQNCPYCDPDETDLRSLHIRLEENGELLAYLRAFEKPGEQGTVQIGRVLTLRRGCGCGGRLLHEALAVIRERYRPERIFLEAQTYAVGFYEREGFRICSDEFLEDGIPHVGMELKSESIPGI